MVKQTLSELAGREVTSEPNQAQRGTSVPMTMTPKVLKKTSAASPSSPAISAATRTRPGSRLMPKASLISFRQRLGMGRGIVVLDGSGRNYVSPSWQKNAAKRMVLFCYLHSTDDRKAEFTQTTQNLE